MFKIKRVIFNNPATIVFWADGDKTVVKCQNNEPYDPEKGLAMAISKKALGNGNKWYNEFKKQLKVYEETTEIRDSFVGAVKKLQESAKIFPKYDDECRKCKYGPVGSGCAGVRCSECDNSLSNNRCRCRDVNAGEKCPYFKEEKRR